MRGPVPATSYILQSRGQPAAEAQAKYKDLEFKFRRCDLSAVKEILATGEYEFLRDIIKGKDKPYIYDIGAHIGLFSIWSLSVNGAAVITSVEASPKTFDVLSVNAGFAQDMEFNWSIENRAAWKNNDEVRFSDTLESSMSHKGSDEGEVSIKGLTFADILRSLPQDQRIDVMKIDIEGAEEAFLCADGVDFAKIDNLVIELHPQLCNTETIEELLRNSFSHIEEMHDKSLSKPLLYCRK